MKVTIPVEFEVTDNIRNVPMVLRISWLDAKHEDFTADLTCGAGVGNPYLMASAKLGDRRMYATATITAAASQLFAVLEAELRKPAE